MTHAIAPAFTEPDPEPITEITLEWTTTGRCKATVPLDRVREAFGLGGTPDSELSWVVATLAAASPSMLRRLGAHVTDVQVFPVKLSKIDGVDPADL